MFRGKLLAQGGNAKTSKSDKAGEYLTAIMYLAPADTVEGINVCPMAVKAGCKAGCLYTAGRGQMNSVQKARIRKTILWRDQPDLFLKLLHQDITDFKRYCAKKGKKAAVRLNGTSDIMFEVEDPTLFSLHPDVMYYDYTKIYKRAYKKLPDNYHLTLSYSGANKDYAYEIIKAHEETGINVAVVYRTKAMVEEMIQIPGYISGDDTDMRFLDETGKVVCLYAKGKAKQDQSGFVIDAPVRQSINLLRLEAA